MFSNMKIVIKKITSTGTSIKLFKNTWRKGSKLGPEAHKKPTATLIQIIN
jgi:hypothetical protein